MKRQRIKQFIDGIFLRKLCKLLVFSCFTKSIHLILGDGQKNVMKVNTDTKAIMSSDSDGNNLMDLMEVNSLVFVTACCRVNYDSLQD